MAGIVNRKTIKIHEAEVTVRNSTAWTVTDAETVQRKLILALGKDVDENGITYRRVTDIQGARLGLFVLMLCNTEEVRGDLGFDWPLPSASADELIRAFNEVGDCLTGDEIDRWQKALREVDTPPGDPDLFPSADPEAVGQKRK